MRTLVVDRYRLRSRNPVHYIEMYNRVMTVRYATTNKSYVAYRVERNKPMVLIELINSGRELVREEVYIPKDELPRVLRDLGFSS